MYSFDITQTPCCTRFGRVRQQNGWERGDSRSIKQNLFVLVIDGEADFYVEQQMYSLKKGDVLIIPANTLYRANTRAVCEYFFVHFEGAVVRAEPKTQQLPRSFSFELPRLSDPYIYFFPHTHAGEDFQRLQNCMVTCADLRAQGTLIGQRMLECEFLRTLLILAQICQQRQNGDLPIALERMMVYIQKNLTKPIGVEMLCRECGLSPSYAGRLFRKYMDMTATEYINGEKLQYACELMKNTAMSLSEIADYLGYCDVYYFSRRFKRKFGEAPSRMFPK